MKSIYEIRKLGEDYCKTEGSGHYKQKDGIEPIDLLINNDLIEDFCIGNMIKYAFRFKKTRNLEDLKKVSDYAHILCGNELAIQISNEEKKKWELNKLTDVAKKEVYHSESFGD